MLVCESTLTHTMEDGFTEEGYEVGLRQRETGGHDVVSGREEILFETRDGPTQGTIRVRSAALSGGQTQRR